MDFPIKHGDFPVRYVKLPEGKSPKFIPLDPGISDPEVALWAVLARGGAYTSTTQMVSGLWGKP